MKTLKFIFFLSIALADVSRSEAQTLNWASLRAEQRNVINVNLGYDFSFNYGLGYARQLRSKLPTLLNAEISQPTGEEMFDDFKTKIGGQIRVYQINNVHFSVKIQGVFRRYHTDYVRMLNFGSDLSAAIGYYKPRWFASGEFGFDKAIVTHFKHSEVFRENFPGVKDGWYKPATGGNFFFGLQTGLSFKTQDIILKVGKVVQQDLKTKPTIPLYFQISFVKRF
jgi:hypothetical protein